MVDELRAWVRAAMKRCDLKQSDIANALGMTQGAISMRLNPGPNAIPFKLEDVLILEKLFDEPSPLRTAAPDKSAIQPVTLHAVVKYVAKARPDLIRADAETLAEAIVALCEYVQNANRETLTEPEVALAMRRVTEKVD